MTSELALMTSELATRLIDDIGALLLFTMILVLGAGQITKAIYAMAVQSLLIGVGGIILGVATGNVELWIIAGITVIVKAVALPWLLIWVMRKIDVRREVEPVIPIVATLGIAGGIVVLSFSLGTSLGPVRQAITGDALPVGISLTLLGVLMMVSRRKALTQMVGLFACENGIFFTAMAVSEGMPLIIEIGVILDVVLGALVMGILVLRVRSAVAVDVADLEELKG